MVVCVSKPSFLIHRGTLGIQGYYDSLESAALSIVAGER